MNFYGCIFCFIQFNVSRVSLGESWRPCDILLLLINCIEGRLGCYKLNSVQKINCWWLKRNILNVNFECRLTPWNISFYSIVYFFPFALGAYLNFCKIIFYFEFVYTYFLHCPLNIYKKSRFWKITI